MLRAVKRFTSLLLCDSFHFFFQVAKGRPFEYDEGDPAALLLKRGVIPDYEGE